jgi:excisionase family DNA binding protein
MENNRYLNAYDIAEILNVSKVTVYSWMQKGYIEFSLSGNLQRVTRENLLKYLKKIGNSQGAMKDFEEDIDNFFRQKDEINKWFLEAKNDEEKVKRVAMLSGGENERRANRFKDGIKELLEKYKIAKANDPFKASEEAEKYINESKTPEEKTKRVAEVNNYTFKLLKHEEKIIPKPWNEDK